MGLPIIVQWPGFGETPTICLPVIFMLYLFPFYAVYKWRKIQADRWNRYHMRTRFPAGRSETYMWLSAILGVYAWLALAWAVISSLLTP